MDVFPVVSIVRNLYLALHGLKAVTSLVLPGALAVKLA